VSSRKHELAKGNLKHLNRHERTKNEINKKFVVLFRKEAVNVAFPSIYTLK